MDLSGVVRRYHSNLARSFSIGEPAAEVRAQVDRTNRVFEATFAAGDGVRPGISANVTVTVDSVKGCVAVPVSAVFVDGADRLVYVRGADGEWEARKVKVGLSDAGWSQVKEGVEAGAAVSLVRPALPR